MRAIKAVLISISLAILAILTGLYSAKSIETDESKELKELKSATMKAGDMSDNTKRTDDEWRQLLSEEQFRVTRQCGTEPAFTGKYYNFHEDGKYVCVCCGNELFLSDSKYDSGSGWPSFFKPLNDSAIAELEDNSLGMRRIEIRCNHCGAHLGHVFDDGPRPTGLRYCVNSISLKFVPDSAAVKATEEKDN